MDTAEANAAKLEGRVDTEDDSPGNSSEDSYDWKIRRTTSKVIESVKKRVAMQKSPPHSTDGAEEETSTAHPDRPAKSLSLDEKLEELCPEIKNLSIESQKVLSLDRNRSLFKSAPTYNTLECMFGPSVSNTASAFYSPFDKSNSLYSSFRSNDSGLPSVTSRNHSDSAKLSPDFSISLESDTFEPAANDDPKAEVKSEASEKSQEKSHDSPTRPPYFKSISSPSKIMNFVQQKFSSGSRSSEENDDNKSDSPRKKPPRKFKDAANNPSYKSISKLPSASLGLPIDDDTKEEDERARKEMQEIAEALKSPTIKEKPFRERSGAVRLSVEERPRSSSAPSSPGCDFKSHEAEELNSTSD